MRSHPRDDMQLSASELRMRDAIEQRLFALPLPVRQPQRHGQIDASAHVAPPATTARPRRGRWLAVVAVVVAIAITWALAAG